MRQIIFNLDASDKRLIFNNFVVQGENLATELVFNLSPEFQSYKYLIKFQNNSKSPIISPELTAIDNVVKYTLTNAVTANAGMLKIQFQAYDDNNKLIKSLIANLPVKESINGDAEIMPEDMVPWYIQAVEQASIATEEASKLASYNAEMNERIDNLVSGLTQESEVIDSRSSSVKGKTFVNLKSRLEENEQDLAEHKAETMPHEITNLKTGKTYRYGYQVSAEGIPQVISEEVI